MLEQLKLQEEVKKRVHIKYQGKATA